MIDEKMLAGLIVTPEDFKNGAEKTDYRARVMIRMASQENQAFIEIADAKRDMDWAVLCNQVVGSEL